MKALNLQAIAMLKVKKEPIRPGEIMMHQDPAEVGGSMLMK